MRKSFLGAKVSSQSDSVAKRDKCKWVRFWFVPSDLNNCCWLQEIYISMWWFRGTQCVG